MAEDDGDDVDELPSVDHGPLNEGPWEKDNCPMQAPDQTFCIYNPKYYLVVEKINFLLYYKKYIML